MIQVTEQLQLQKESPVLSIVNELFINLSAPQIYLFVDFWVIIRVVCSHSNSNWNFISNA